jgi:hypothetical protein
MLPDFRKTSRFDMYHQSPWVAGSTLSAILGNAQMLGISYLGSEGIFGSFLHAYNMPVSIGMLEKIDVLEYLCSLFLKEAFMGLRPNNNFSTNLFRFGGAKLTQLNSSKKHVLFMPNSVVARESAENVSTQPRCHSSSIVGLRQHFRARDRRKACQRHGDQAHGQCIVPVQGQRPHRLQRGILGDTTACAEAPHGGIYWALAHREAHCFKVYELVLQVWKEVTAKFTVIQPEFKLAKSL